MALDQVVFEEAWRAHVERVWSMVGTNMKRKSPDCRGAGGMLKP